MLEVSWARFNTKTMTSDISRVTRATRFSSSFLMLLCWCYLATNSTSYVFGKCESEDLLRGRNTNLLHPLQYNHRSANLLRKWTKSNKQKGNPNFTISGKLYLTYWHWWGCTCKTMISLVATHHHIQERCEEGNESLEQSYKGIWNRCEMKLRELGFVDSHQEAAKEVSRISS